MSALRRYEPPFMPDGYPCAWHTIKHFIRQEAGHRCLRCGHPYRVGAHASGEWTPCDDRCTHGGPYRFTIEKLDGPQTIDVPVWGDVQGARQHGRVLARWRILTVHHLDGDKGNCLWWNLAALCQRCHLTIQGRVVMERDFIAEHSEWFKPFAAGWYAWKYEGREIERDEAIERMDELLAYEQRMERLPV